MLPEELFIQPPREAPFGPNNTFIAPSLLRACCACGLVENKAEAIPGLERWISQRTYREAHGVGPVELVLTHTFCPACFAKVRKVMRQSFQKPESEP